MTRMGKLLVGAGQGTKDIGQRLSGSLAAVLCLMAVVLPGVARAGLVFSPSSVTVEAGKTVQVTLTNDSTKNNYELLLGSKTVPTTNPYSTANYEVTSASLSLPIGQSVTMTVRGLAKTSSAQTFTVYRQDNPDSVSAQLKISVTAAVTPPEPQTVTMPVAQSLVYSGKSQTCIDNSAGKFTLGGTWQATSAGNYTATVAPADGYCWSDKSTDAKNLGWSIARKPATITATSTSKVVGAADPAFEATVAGVVDGFQPSYTVERTDKSESLGTYTLYATGAAEQGNYTFSYANGTFEIVEAKTAYTGDVEVKEVDGGTVYIFSSGDCTLTLAKNAVADILVVGGGGGGGAAYYGGNTSKYNGNGGNGGEVKYVENQPIAAGEKLTIKVGKGGAGGAGAAKSSSAPAGASGEASSLSYGTVSISAASGSGGAGGTSKSNNNVGSAGKNAQTLDITGDDVAYGQAGSKAPSSGTASDSKANTGNGGQGGRASSTQGSRDGGDGGSGVVIVRIMIPRTPIAAPTAATGLVFDNTVQTGVAAGDFYTVSGNTARDAGDYTATVTPADGYCWSDTGKYDARTIKWSIARRKATVTVVSTNKVVGATFTDPDQQTYDDPIWTTRAEGLVESDTATLTWDIFRTNACEEVGTYDLLVEGAKQQGNYDISYVGGTYEIRVAPPPGPSIADNEGELAYDPDAKEVVVTPKENVTDVEIINMPADATAKVPVTVGSVKGVEPTQIKVIYTQTGVQTPQTYDITKAFAITGNATEGVTIALNGAASVEIPLAGGGNETVTVEPQLTESGDPAVEPFEVMADEVDVGVKTVPGLVYNLKRSETVVTVSKGGVVDSKRAETTRTRLSDPMKDGKPEKAFYVIEVKK